MHFPPGAMVDPLADEIDLLVRQSALGVGGRHALLLLLCADALIETAGRGISGNDDGMAGAVGEHAFLDVQAQARHPLFFVGAVAGEAIVGEDRADIAVEIHSGGRGGERQPGDST